MKPNFINPAGLISLTQLKRFKNTSRIHNKYDN